MTKNIFEDNKRINIFDSFNFESKTNNENANSSSKNSKRSNFSSFKEHENKQKEPVIKEVHETPCKQNKSKVTLQEPPASAPAMYKIAMRIKKLTENKMKKTQLESTTLSDKSLKEDFIKIKSEVEQLQKPLNEDFNSMKDDIIDFELELDSSKTSGDKFKK